jgi:hypothetical protein
MAQAEVARLALPTDTAPDKALMKALAISFGNVLFYQSKIQELRDGKSEWYRTKVVTEQPFVNGHGESPETGEPNGLAPVAELKIVKTEYAMMLEVYEEKSLAERRHFLDVSKTMVVCGFIDRQIKLEEFQATLIAQSMRGFAAELGLDPSDPQVMAAMRKHLLLAEGAGGTIDVTPARK